AVLLGLFIITLSEVLIWIFWLNLADGKIAWLASPYFMTNFIIAGVVLMALMLVEHSIEIGALRNNPLLKHVTNPKTILFTFMEVAGAMGWLYFVRTGDPFLGAVCLLVGLSIEHILQGSDLRPS
ncbi:MAG: hypothetical protein AAFU67_18260, partial [Bacteroidota bacterium]